MHVPVYLAAPGPANLRLTGELADGWTGNSFFPETADVCFDPWVHVPASGVVRPPMHPVIVVLGGWLVAQPVICAGWAYLMRDRRHLGGN